MNATTNNVVITGMGALSPIGVGIDQFTRALKSGDTNFSEVNITHGTEEYHFPAALISGFDYNKALEALPLAEVPKKKAIRLRNMSIGAGHGVYAALEAFADSGLDSSANDLQKAALVCAGSNLQQDKLVTLQQRYQKKLRFINPTYGFTFLDTDLVGILSELLSFQGEGYSIGAASASGAMALINGCRLIASGEYDIVLVVAPSMELSAYEYQGLTALGAMASINEDTDIARLCTPFDQKHCGFVYGQNAAALILESESHALERGAVAKGRIAGYGSAMDGNRNPNPNVTGETRAMEKALTMSGFSAADLEYLNTHGTASVIGDKTEVEAIVAAGMTGIKANASKGLIGHGITSAGLIEAVACLVQINGMFLHPNPGLQDPITDQIDWVGTKAMETPVKRVISNSLGFGGINTSIIFEAIEH